MVTKIRTLFLLVLSLCFCIPHKTYPLADPFKKLKRKSLEIPTFRELYGGKKVNGLGQLIDEALYSSFRLVSLERLEATLDEFFTVMDALLKQSYEWLDGDDSAFKAMSTPQSSFLPYAQKLIKAPGSSCMFKGDLHGDIHSLIAAVSQLKELGITSSKDPLKIKDPSFHLIFLGDYVDRGLWGTEVLFLLMLLKIANPQQVILVRGNHEDPQVAARYGFRTEFFAKFSESSEEDRERCYQKICALYDYLPAVLYLGSGTDTHKNILQCCHGGLEIGYNPKAFLKSADTISFHSIHSLNRLTECKSLPSFLVQGYKQVPLEYYCLDFVPDSPMDLGFLWNDFVVDAQESSLYNAARGFAFNKEVTQAVLQAASTDEVTVVGVIRAHQHVPCQSDPLMALLLSSHGCALLWDHDKSPTAFTPGMVFTLLLSPDSLAGQPRESYDGSLYYSGFTYDTSLMLTSGSTLQEWEATVLNTAVYEGRKRKKQV